MTRFRCRPGTRRGRAGRGAKQRRDIEHAIEHQQLQADQDSLYEAAVLQLETAAAVAAAAAEAEAVAAEAEAAEAEAKEAAEAKARGAATANSTPQCSAVAPASAPAPSLPAAGRASRRLRIEMPSTNTLEPTAREPVGEGDAASLSCRESCPGSPSSCCSQRRFQEYEHHIRSSRYPTPPGAPRDQLYPESESEAGSPLRGPPTKLFRNGELLYHKAFMGARPITYVDTRLYEGGSNDYFEAYNQSDLQWVRRINSLLEAHNIPRWDDK